jgi:DNA-directed RNA polymerase beta' subunit
VHDKYNPKHSPEDVINDFIEEFEYSCSIKATLPVVPQDLEANLKKVVIDMDALKALKLFKLIVEEDLVFFNMDGDLCKPEDMIITCIPTPPSCIRPTVAVNHGMKNEDDLTIKLAEIV